MISPENFYHHLLKSRVNFFCGVPDSLLKNLLDYFQTQGDGVSHFITANEGLAIALATGYYLSSGNLPLVYMQNSGLGNAINPLTSLADKEVYSIPVLLLIGWRGMPGTQDEPQHKKMGRITEKMLEALTIPYFILKNEEQDSIRLTSEAIELALTQKQPVALLAPPGIFSNNINKIKLADNGYPLSRETALKILLRYLRDEIVVCTTGKTGREFYELNKEIGFPVGKYFLSVGAMGLANHTALGMDLELSERVVMIDGDGSLLMHMGSLSAIGKWANQTFVHIMINNGCHESVGAQPTLGFEIDFCEIAKACGYQKVFCIEDEQTLADWVQNDFTTLVKQFVEIRVNEVSRTDLGRPSGNPIQWKEELMEALHSDKTKS